MRKLSTLLLALVICAASFGQSNPNPSKLKGFRPVYVIPDTTVKFGQRVEAGDKVRVTSTGMEYVLKIPVGLSVNMGWVLKDSTRYTLTTSTITNITNITNQAIDTALIAFTNSPNVFTGPQTITNSLGVSGNVGIGTTGYNKFIVLGATGSTAIKGTLLTEGVATFYKSPVTMINSFSNTNTGMGYQALLSLASGSLNNTAFGSGALTSLLNGQTNVAVGKDAMRYANKDTASENTAIGYQSLNLNQSYGNVGVGYKSLYNSITGRYNTAIGNNSGIGNKSGLGNVFIGSNSGPSGTTSIASNKLYINNAAGGADTALIYGDFSAKTLELNGAVKVKNGVVVSAVSDTATVKTAGRIVYIDGDFYGSNGTTWMKLNN